MCDGISLCITSQGYIEGKDSRGDRNDSQQRDNGFVQNGFSFVTLFVSLKHFTAAVEAGINLLDMSLGWQSLRASFLCVV